MIVDLSHNNRGPIDFVRAKKAGLKGVILKATQGTHFADPAFAARYDAAFDAGLPLGCYHFLNGTDTVSAQMEWFLDTVEPPFDGLLLAIDLERDTTHGERTATPAMAAAAALYLEQKIGRLPVIYTGRWGPAGNGAGLPNPTLARCPLWLPAYNDHEQQVCPPGWDAFKLHQYTDKGMIDGIPAPVDFSRFAGSDDELAAWWGT